MKTERILDAIGSINEETILDAKQYKSTVLRKWWKWGALAACLCLVIAAVTVWYIFGNLAEGGRGGDLGGVFSDNDGTWQEGVNPVVASVALVPNGVDLLDVADATCVPIKEEDARNVRTLGKYIPNILPEGCWYGKASYYKTIMKDGTRYHMIRVAYESGEISVSGDGECTSETANTAFLWMVWGHQPDSVLPVYQPEEISVSLIDQQDGGVFYINYDGIYVGIEQLDISAEDLFSIIESIG